jgi:hypothetical protein
MKRWMNFWAVMVLSGLVFAELSFAQRGGATESKFLTIGDVSRIDVKNKSITINDATSYNIAQLRNGAGVSAVPGGRAGGGGAVRAGGRGGRRGAVGGGSAPGAGRGASAPIPMEYKVTVSSKTVIKEGDIDIKIEDLRVGDRLQVFSLKGGTKLGASEIIRTPKSEP